MHTTHTQRLTTALVGVLALILFTGCTDAQDARSKLGAVPEFHPELGLGALEGYLGLAAITAKPAAELHKLQADLIAAVAPFTVETGDSAAFFTTPDDPIIDPTLIHYVSVFVPEHSGEHFVPHLTIGLAPKTHLDELVAKPFEKYTFSPASAAVYQLGQFGTAAKKLKEPRMLKRLCLDTILGG